MPPKTENQLKLLESKRQSYFSRLQRVYDKSKNITDDISRESFLADVTTLPDLRDKFDTIIENINSINLDLNPEFEPNFEPCIAFEELYGIIQHKTAKINEKTTHIQKSNISKLPRLELPSFNGNFQNWPVFYEVFRTTIHENSELSDSQKIQYLVGKLTDKAQTVFAGLTPAAENYSIIWNTLVTKYQDVRGTGAAYCDMLLDLKPITQTTSNNLESFIDQFSSYIAALKQLKIPDLTEFLLIHIGMKKLDRETAQEFEMSIRKTDIPKYDDFITFIRERAKILQRTTINRISNLRPIGNQNKLNNNGYKRPGPSAHAFVGIEENPNRCLFCHKNDHDVLYKCSDFLKEAPENRFNSVKKHKCCVNCLSAKHATPACKSTSRCRRCNLKHHTLLHFQNTSSAKNYETSVSPTDVALCTLSSVGPRSHTPNINQVILLGTARLNTITAKRQIYSIRALIDSASQNNFITDACCKRLGLRPLPSRNHAFVKGIGGKTHPVKGITCVTLSSRHNNDLKFTIQPLIVDRITDELPSTIIDVSSLSYLQDLQLADDSFHMPEPIDMILGVQIFTEILLQGKILGSVGQPHALETKLGYIVMGPAPIANSSYRLNNYVFCSFNNPSIENLMAKFWELEEIPTLKFLSQEDQKCEEIYSNTTTRDTSGRYTVALPFKDDVALLGNSIQTATRRFLSLERKLAVSPPLRLTYDGAIREYLDKGYLSRVRSEGLEDCGYYIPHHAVIREDKTTTKLRIVMDASAKTSSTVSLNDILYAGENLQLNLFNILLNVRLFPIAINADVRQMYLQVGVLPEHRKFQRILYRFDPSEPLTTFEITRVCFGLKCSPFLALRTVRRLASDERSRFPLASEVVTRDIYMDDVVTSVMTPSDAIELSNQLIELFKAGGFDLVKFSSNSHELLARIPEEHCLSQAIDFKEEHSIKILGLRWIPSSDVFTFVVNPEITNCTKRSILSCIAKLWDVMGFVAPVILYAKLLIKTLWLLKLDWDDIPPQNIISAWSQFQAELPDLERLEIPRHLGVTSNVTLTLIGFGDASEKAYGGVVYLHVSYPDRRPNKLTIVCAKSKLSPLKVISLARLELCAALLLSKLLRIVVDTYNPRYRLNNVFAFSDSTVALSWIHSSPHRWQTFVSNRVAKIHENLPASKFYHISGNENPSDCLSRGLLPSQIIDHPLWLHGPPWLQSDSSVWPIQPFTHDKEAAVPEEKTFVLSTTSAEEPFLYTVARRVSSWSRLLHIVVYVLRFTKILPRSGKISVSDLYAAESRLLMAVQTVHFSEDIKNIQRNQPASNTLRKLNPHLKDGLLRVGGRLANAELSAESKHPVLLPKSDHVVNLIIDYYHSRYMHTGPHLLMSLLRQQFWILSARNIVRKRTQMCNICFKTNPKVVFPMMADLPACRVRQAKPFCHTGVDYAGPFTIVLNRYRGCRTQKAYLCLFVCLVTRALHLELVSDLSTESFLNAFKRFLSRRGPCSTMYSDCGTNFIGAKSHLDSLYSFLASEEYNGAVNKHLISSKIEWKLNPPRAPHFGGIWEANVRSVKTHLYRVIGIQVLTYEELYTVLTQIEALLNSRPLSLLSGDPSEPLALTPAHFLTLTPLTSLPTAAVSEQPLSTIKRKFMLDHMVQNYWSRWSLEYLHTLQVRQKWNTPSHPIVKGMVVLVREDNSPPLHWPLGVIEEIYPGTDAVTRVVLVRTKSGSYKRPVVKICPLPTQ